TDTVNYNNASKTVHINVQKGTPVITWTNPADITYGTTLGATQLNATASVAGSFVYTPAAATQLNAGPSQNLKVDFTPTDTVNYNTASKTVPINVLKKPVTVKATSVSRVFGQSTPVFSIYTSVGTLASGDTLA